MPSHGISLDDVASQTLDVIDVAGGHVTVSEITHDSRQVRPGTLFVALRGEQFDGHQFIDEARVLGASAILVEQEEPGAGPQIVVVDSRRAMAWAARAIFAEPDASLWIAGVTGTNGKTTVAHMVEAVFHAAQIPVGLVGTLGARIDGVPISTARTTPEATDLQRILATMRDQGVQAVMMEVSSHAIALHRSDAISFKTVAFTNLSRDHLDFHGDMETYFGVKARLFREEIADTAIVNIGDSWGLRLATRLEMPLVTVSAEGTADIQATKIVLSSEGTAFNVTTPVGETVIRLPLAGRFNVSNALVALGIALEAQVSLEVAGDGLSRLEPIAGRMEIIKHTGPFTVVVDYAHTSDAIGVVLQAARQMTRGRVVSVLGAGGERDKEKRSLMGGAAARSSDVMIVTTDNPRSEDPALIATEVSRGAEIQGGASVTTILDRSDAIRAAIEIAEDGDIVLILGKGHEQGQDIGTEILPFDDKQEALAALAGVGWVQS